MCIEMHDIMADDNYGEENEAKLARQQSKQQHAGKEEQQATMARGFRSLNGSQPKPAWLEQSAKKQSTGNEDRGACSSQVTW